MTMKTGVATKITFVATVFLFFVFDCQFVTAADHKTFIEHLVDRAKNFEKAFSDKNVSDILQMFPEQASESHEILFLLRNISQDKDDLITSFPQRTEFYNAVQDYGISISDRETSPFELNIIHLVFFASENEEDSLSLKKLASYVERGGNLNMQAQIDFHKNLHPDFCEISFDNSSIEARIEWDDDKISSFTNPQVFTGKIEKWPYPILHPNENRSKNSSVSLQVPDFVVPKDKVIQDVFARFKRMAFVQRIEELQPMYKWDLTKTPDSVGGICFVASRKRYTAFGFFTQGMLHGYFVEFNHKGNVKAYREGKMKVISHLMDKDTADFEADLLNGFIAFDLRLKIEQGIEIQYYPNGIPLSYKTFVKQNRLFGRQIEWNDKGEVVSDVDLDIPIPWPDAPKLENDTKTSE